MCIRDRQHAHAYLQPFSRKTGQQRYYNDYYGGTALWCPSAQVSLNLKNRDLDRQDLRSKLKISYAASPCVSQLISVQFALERERVFICQKHKIQYCRTMTRQCRRATKKANAHQRWPPMGRYVCLKWWIKCRYFKFSGFLALHWKISEIHAKLQQ